MSDAHGCIACGLPMSTPHFLALTSGTAWTAAVTRLSTPTTPARIAAHLLQRMLHHVKHPTHKLFAT